MSGGGSTTTGLRVLLIAPAALPIDPERYGGVELSIYFLARELSKHVKVSVAAPRGSKVPGVEVVETIEPAGWAPDAERRHYEAYRGLLGEFDLVHDHTHEKWAYLEELEDPKLKIVGTLHGLQTWRSRLGPPVTYPNLVCLSQYHKRVTESTYNFEVEVVPLGIDLDLYRFKEDKEDFILSFNLVAPHKGHLYAILIARRLGLPIIVAGEDEFVPDRDYVRRVKEACSRYPKAEYLGKVDLRAKLDLLSRARCLLFPSLRGEAFSLVALEAMASGTPVVAFRRGALPELVGDGVGRLADSLEGLARCVEEVGEVRPERCRAWVAERFSVEAVARRYLELYGRVLRGDGWGPRPP